MDPIASSSHRRSLLPWWPPNGHASGLWNSYKVWGQSKRGKDFLNSCNSWKRAKIRTNLIGQRRSGVTAGQQHCSVTFKGSHLSRPMQHCIRLTISTHRKTYTLHFNLKQKNNNHVYTELSIISITPTTIRSSAMRCHSLSIWGFEDTAGMSCVLSSEASSFDSSSESHRALRPSWTGSAKTMISNDKCV